MLFPNKRTIFTQGDPADAIFYLQTGKVRLTGISIKGRDEQFNTAVSGRDLSLLGASQLVAAWIIFKSVQV